jgi:hypothetical protein
MLKGEHIMDKNKNVRLGLIELWKNKARTLGYTQKEVDERNNQNFFSKEEYDILTEFYREYEKGNVK